jgi:hypothetical protein
MIHFLFNDTFSTALVMWHQMLGWSVSNESERMWKRIMYHFVYHLENFSPIQCVSLTVLKFKQNEFNLQMVVLWVTVPSSPENGGSIFL